MFGGHGSRKMLTIAKRVAAAGLKTQLIFMCGHNQHLREQLMALELPFPFHIEGFTREIPYFMNLADYFVGKPGPGSISEALVMRLPVIVERNSWTMVQERYNTDWIVSNRVGVVLHSFAEIATAIVPMLDPRAAGAISRARRRAQQSRDFRNPGNPRHHHREALAPDSSRCAAHDVMAGSLADESQRRARKLGRESLNALTLALPRRRVKETVRRTLSGSSTPIFDHRRQISPHRTLSPISSSARKNLGDIGCHSASPRNANRIVPGTIPIIEAQK